LEAERITSGFPVIREQSKQAMPFGASNFSPGGLRFMGGNLPQLEWRYNAGDGGKWVRAVVGVITQNEL
jgi:hypothetical protein